jgi:hypothetical protein
MMPPPRRSSHTSQTSVPPSWPSGCWTGFRFGLGPPTHSPLLLTLRAAAGIVAGSGAAAARRVDVFGMYGADAGRLVLVLTTPDGASTELEGRAHDGAIVGTWMDDRGTQGAFTLRPLRALQ